MSQQRPPSATTQPRLRCDLNLGTLSDLPDWSTGPRGDDRAVRTSLKAAGFDGIQGHDPQLCAELGLTCTASGRVDSPDQALPVALANRDAGFALTTLHVGTGFEDDATIDRLCEAIVAASAESDHQLLIETHRATITTDIYRTVRLAERHPDIRFNGDFSHWYTGHEMVYGDWEAKLAFIAPMLERVDYFHGRIGNPSHMQVAITGEESYVDHFRELWTRAMAAWIDRAAPGAELGFAPEILPPAIHYARCFPDAAGQPREESDRWQQALLYCDIARACFAHAQSQVTKQP
ncbi:MAG: hypothetical protein PF961_06870 [Planctomycetota bacterium]|jgi:hypothetical protein|nr:hypothetical protein [Planctomycetota bacterium]